MQNKMHKLMSNVEKGEESINRDIPDRYQFSQEKGDSGRRLYSHLKFNEGSHGKK